jgi:translocator protein
MTPSSTFTGRFWAILVLLSTIGMIAVNYLAATGAINGVTPAQISERYPTLATPANYAFSIWMLIYAGLLAFSVYQLLPANVQKYRRLFRTIYIASCVLNGLWVYFWHSQRITLCFAIIILLCVCLFLINRFLRTSKSAGEYWLVNGPFGLYFGWVTAAMLVNFSVLLVSWNFPISPSTWNVIGVVIVLLAGILGVLMRIRLGNYFYPLAIAWALTAVAIKQSGNTPIVFAAAVSVVGCLIASLSFVLKLPDANSRVSINEQR